MVFCRHQKHRHQQESIYIFNDSHLPFPFVENKKQFLFRRGRVCPHTERRLATRQENARQTGRCESPPVDLRARGALRHRVTPSFHSTGLILGLAELRTRK